MVLNRSEDHFQILHEDETTRIGLSEDEKGHIGEPHETLGAFFTLKFLLTSALQFWGRAVYIINLRP